MFGKLEDLIVLNLDIRRLKKISESKISYLNYCVFHSVKKLLKKNRKSYLPNRKLSSVDFRKTPTTQQNARLQTKLLGKLATKEES